MGLGIFVEDGLYCPTFFCDGCGDRIRETGTYLFRRDPDGNPVMPLYTVHKGHTRLVEAKHSPEWRWSSSNLRSLPLHLAHNFGMTEMAQSFALHEELRRLAGGRDNLAPVEREQAKIPPLLRSLVLKRDEVCLLCGSDEELEVDHIVPVARGGGNHIENLRVLCGPCNRAKSDEFAGHAGRRSRHTG